MKQRRLVRELYKACVAHDDSRIAELRKQEFQKILQRKDQGKTFNPRWTLVRV